MFIQDVYYICDTFQLFVSERLIKNFGHRLYKSCEYSLIFFPYHFKEGKLERKLVTQQFLKMDFLAYTAEQKNEMCCLVY